MGLRSTGVDITTYSSVLFFFFQAEDGIRDLTVTGVQTCALPISAIGDQLNSHFGGNWSRAVLLGGNVDTDTHGVAHRARSYAEADLVPAGIETEIGRASCRERV